MGEVTYPTLLSTDHRFYGVRSGLLILAVWNDVFTRMLEGVVDQRSITIFAFSPSLAIRTQARLREDIAFS